MLRVRCVVAFLFERLTGSETINILPRVVTVNPECTRLGLACTAQRMSRLTWIEVSMS